MKTLSGDRVVKTPFVVIKYGTRETAEQGKLMQTLPHSADVIYVGANWYMMKRLHHCRDWPWTTTLDMLRDIWKLPATTGLDWEHNLRQLLTRRKSMLLEYMDRPCRELDGTKSIQTHGDPTWEHVMTDYDRFYLIDPVQRPYLPPSPITDLAKMGQSLMGWELVRYGWRLPKHMKLPILMDMQEEAPTEHLWFWTALCFQRIYWRHPEGTVGAWCKTNIHSLIERKSLL